MKSDLDPSSDDALPPGLLADLHRVQRTPIVPPAVDARIRADARVYFDRQRRVRLWVRVGGGLAAAVLIVVGVRLATGPWPAGPSMQMVQHEAPPAVPEMAAPSATSPATRPLVVVDPDILRKDIDRSGKVDILDAFTVARGMKIQQTQSAWDITGDGAVDRQDVEQIAAAAVAVKGGVQ